MAIDWSKAPEGAEFYGQGLFWFSREGDSMYWCNFNRSWTHSEHWHHPKKSKDYCERPVEQQWPEENRIDIIATNGNDGMHYDEQREQHEQTQPVSPQANKYDRTILGKYGSGKCTVDVYRVLNAFPSGSPEIDHAIKKLLAPGKRGVKSELQDLKEAIQSIEARIDYLKELGK